MRLRFIFLLAGFELSPAQAHILPIILAPDELALKFSQLLLERGFMVPAIRQPSVPKGQARLRISLMSSHDWTDIDELFKALLCVGRTLGTIEPTTHP